MTSIANVQTATYQHNAAKQRLQIEQADYICITDTCDDNGSRTKRIVQPCPVISGVVLDKNGEGIEGVSLIGLPGNPVTDITGFYSVQVEPGWSGTALPQQTDDTFEPVECVYHAGVPPQYTLTVQIVGVGHYGLRPPRN